ncbi:MAG: c-type cytochrome [Polaromonas sp.]
MALGWLGAFLPALAATDAVRGEQLYVRCIACHALATDRVGPRHCGLLGRRAGSVQGFEYSQAMKKSGLVWDEKTLDRFLAKPLAVVPGSSMTYDGVPQARDRADLMAYLKAVNGTPSCGQ